MKILTVEHIIELHSELISSTGGSMGIRDIGLLESAVNAPFSSFDSNPFYPTIETKAARLAFGIIKNHPFIDGNKRCGLLSMLVFLEINGILLEYNNDELVKVGMDIADGGAENILRDFILTHQL